MKKADSYIGNFLGVLVTLFNLPGMIVFPKGETWAEVVKEYGGFTWFPYIIFVIIGLCVILPLSIVILSLCAILGIAPDDPGKKPT
jgi:uncharacterized membrane protein YdjX (TVP38/TMEM64 family)